MNPTILVSLIVLLFIVLKQERDRQTVQKQMIKKKKQKERKNSAMVELAREMVGKECLIYTFNGTQLTGTIAEIHENARLVDNGKEREIVNLDYVVRIREYPKNKKGKKKSVVLD